MVGLSFGKAMAAGAGHAADRGQPPGGPRGLGPAGGDAALSLPAAAGLRRATASSCWWPASAADAAWARPSTMRRARPSTRSPRRWGCPIPAGRRWSVRRPRAIPSAFLCPARWWAAVGFSFSGLKTALRHRLAEPPGGCKRRSSRQLSGGGDRLSRRPHGPWHRDGQGPGAGDRPGGGRRRGRQHQAARASRQVATAAACRSSPRRSILYRQCGDDRLGEIERLASASSDGLDFAPRPRWPLDPTANPGARLSDDEALAPGRSSLHPNSSQLALSQEGGQHAIRHTIVSIRTAHQQLRAATRPAHQNF